MFIAFVLAAMAARLATSSFRFGDRVSGEYTPLLSC